MGGQKEEKETRMKYVHKTGQLLRKFYTYVTGSIISLCAVNGVRINMSNDGDFN